MSNVLGSAVDRNQLVAKQAAIQVGANVLNGVSEGVSDSGKLLMNINGRQQAFSGGEISVRRVV